MPDRCVSPYCRPAPRPTGGRSNLCPGCEDRVRDHLNQLAADWPELENRLEPVRVAGEKVTASADESITLDQRVVACRAAVTDTAVSLAQHVAACRSVTPPGWVRERPDVPALLRWLARVWVPWLSAQPDPVDSGAMAKDLTDLARESRSLAWPSGARRFDIPNLVCPVILDETGQRCGGAMFAIVGNLDKYTLPDLRCSVHDTHRVEPTVWTRRRFVATAA